MMALETLATIVAVAAWCGQPIAHHPKGILEPVWSTQNVDQCRQELFDCLKDHLHSIQCFTKEKLDK